MKTPSLEYVHLILNMFCVRFQGLFFVCVVFKTGNEDCSKLFSWVSLTLCCNLVQFPGFVRRVFVFSFLLQEIEDFVHASH